MTCRRGEGVQHLYLIQEERERPLEGNLQNKHLFGPLTHLYEVISVLFEVLVSNYDWIPSGSVPLSLLQGRNTSL